MINCMDSKGNLTRASQRIPSGSHWEVYRQAWRDVPDLCRALYNTIDEAVQSKVNAGTREFPNSTWLGRQILKSWARKDEWDAHYDERTSGVLFGEIMWTVMWDDPHAWCTTKTPNANEASEERVYFLTSPSLGR